VATRRPVHIVQFVASLLVLAMAFGMAFIGLAPTAEACTIGPRMELTDQDFNGVQTLEELYADDGALAQRYRSWADTTYGPQPTELPRINSIMQLRTIATMDADDFDYWGYAGILMYEDIWGETPGSTDPFARSFELCRIDPRSELGGTEWRILTDDAIYSLAVDDASMTEANLTRIFGEPLRPQHDSVAEENAQMELLEIGERFIGGQHGEVQWYDRPAVASENPASTDPTADPDTETDTETDQSLATSQTSTTDESSRRSIGMVAVAVFGAVAGLGLVTIRWRTYRGNEN